MRLADITALGRAIDLRYPTNRVIAVLALAVMVAGTGIRLLMDMAWLDSVRWGVIAGLAVFLAWALSRELDPDHDLSAFVGAGLMLLGLVFLGLPTLLQLLWLLAVLRLVNQTSGVPARALDTLGLLGLGGWLVWQGQWIAGVATSLAFLLDARLAPRGKRHGFFAGLALVMTVVLSIFNGNVRMENGPSLPVIVSAVVIGALFGVVVWASRSVESVGDASGQRLNARRVQAAQLLALVVALATAWWQGLTGVGALSPLWAAMLGTAVYKGAAAVYVPHRAEK